MRVKRDRYEIHPVFGKECFEMIDWIIGIVIAAAVVARRNPISCTVSA